MPDNHILKPIVRVDRDLCESPLQDPVVIEEPLEIRVDAQTLTVTMRTPGDDIALAAGFLFSEGIIRDAEDISQIRHCASSSNIIRVTLAPGVFYDSTNLKRHFFANASCGLCGKATIEALSIRSEPLPATNEPSAELICSLPRSARAAQPLFAFTGGSHAAALFDENGALIFLAEDVGRHNATDKVIGHRLLSKPEKTPCPILFISGRASFEIVQKAIAARISTLVAVGAPSSLAVETAQRFSLRLIGFTGPSRFNRY